VSKPFSTNSRATIGSRTIVQPIPGSSPETIAISFSCQYSRRYSDHTFPQMYEMVTALSSAPNPCSTWYGSHGLRSSFSA
jgi:hypothetical protein